MITFTSETIIKSFFYTKPISYLRKRCMQNNLPISGIKRALIKRLVLHFMQDKNPLGDYELGRSSNMELIMLCHTHGISPPRSRNAIVSRLTEERHSNAKFFEEGGYFMTRLRSNDGDCATLFVQYIKPQVLELLDADAKARRIPPTHLIGKSVYEWDVFTRQWRLPESVIRFFWRNVDWGFISRCLVEHLSKEFVNEFKHAIIWDDVPYQKMSVDFVRKFQDCVCWDKVFNVKIFRASIKMRKAFPIQFKAYCDSRSHRRILPSKTY